MKKVDYAYMAGFFDGEGCIRITCQKGTYSLRLQLANTNRYILEWFRFNFGGGIYQISSKVGDWLQWQLTGQKAADCLLTLLPYLKLKRTEAELGLRFWNDRGSSSKVLQEAQKVLISAMKHKGKQKTS